jgi:hypothetical protein
MNDAVAAAQSFESFGPKQTVSVGDDANEEGSSQFSVLGSGY